MPTPEQVAEFLADAKAKGIKPGAGWRKVDLPPTLKCGCTASAVRPPDNTPSCPIHDCTEQVERPDLTDRVATCSNCGKMALSAFGLPFFEYRGPGSREATEMCRCGSLANAHTPEALAKAEASGYPRTCKEFRPNPKGRLTDSYYCGCCGWD